MALNLFFITNNPDVALIAEKNGVNRIWIDLETLGKKERQLNINSIISNHSIEDIKRIKPLLTSSEMLVRVNPWNDNSVNEINAVIAAGADIVMLPMWKTVEEVQNFLTVVNGRVKTTLLLETKDAVNCIDKVLELDFDEIHIGLNDLHLSYGMKFMFELLANGTIDILCEKIKTKGIPYGFGGIASIGKGLLPAEKVIMEHYRLGSTRAILSRSFCNISQCENLEVIERAFSKGMKDIREYEKSCVATKSEILSENHIAVKSIVAMIVKEIESREHDC